MGGFQDPTALGAIREGLYKFQIACEDLSIYRHFV